MHWDWASFGIGVVATLIVVALVFFYLLGEAFKGG